MESPFGPIATGSSIVDDLGQQEHPALHQHWRAQFGTSILFRQYGQAIAGVGEVVHRQRRLSGPVDGLLIAEPLITVVLLGAQQRTLSRAQDQVDRRDGGREGALGPQACVEADGGEGKEAAHGRAGVRVLRRFVHPSVSTGGDERWNGMDERDWPYGMSAGPGHGGLAQWSCWLDREFQCRTDLWTDDAGKVQDRTVELAIAASVPR